MSALKNKSAPRTLLSPRSLHAISVPGRSAYPLKRPMRLEILEDRTGERSTIITSQLPPAKWHDYVADPTLADALCDRLLHPAHRIALKGPSRRKEASPE